MEAQFNQYIIISKQVIISYFFNILMITCQPLLTILLTRSLTIEEYGIYSLLFSTLSIFSVILRLGLAEYIRTKIPGMNDELRKRNMNVIFKFMFLIFCLVALCLYFFRNEIISFLKIQQYQHLWFLTIALILTSTFYDLINAYLISLKKIIISSISSWGFRCGWIIILAGIILFQDNNSLEKTFLIWLWGSIISLSLTFIVLREEIKYLFLNPLRIDSGILKSTLSFSLPVVLFVSLSFIVDSSNRYIINYYLGKVNLAFYSLAFGLAATIASVPLILQDVIQPYFAEKWNLKENPTILYNILFKYSLIIVLPLISGAFVLRKELILLISGNNYLESASILAILLPYSLFLIIIEILNKTLLLRNMLRQILLIYFFGAVVNLMLNLFLIPTMGIMAAAYSTTATYFFILCALFYYRPNGMSIDRNYLKLIRIVFSSLILGLWLRVSLFIPNRLIWLKLSLFFCGIIIYILTLLIFRIFNSEERDILTSMLNRIRRFKINKI